MSVEETVKRVFKSTMQSCNYLMPNGKALVFIFGKFVTDVKEEIEHLEKEISLGHPHIFIDKNEVTTTDSATSNEMIAGLRERIKQELLAEMEKSTDASNDMGVTKQEPVKPASSADVAPAASGGTGAQTISIAGLKDKIAAAQSTPAPATAS